MSSGIEVLEILFKKSPTGNLTKSVVEGSLWKERKKKNWSSKGSYNDRPPFDKITK